MTIYWYTRPRARLFSYLPIPPGVNVDIDDTYVCSSIETFTDEFIVGDEVGDVEGSAEVVVDEVLPCYGETEGIEARG
jgi:hypothetical protein